MQSLVLSLRIIVLHSLSGETDFGSTMTPLFTCQEIKTVPTDALCFSAIVETAGS
jgi:hypothetical protein